IMYNPEYNRFTYELFRPHGTNFAVTNLDDLTVRVVTPEVFAPFVEFFGSIAILPKHVLAAVAREHRFSRAYIVSTNTRPEKVVGSGPYRLKEIQPGKSTLLEANP